MPVYFSGTHLPELKSLATLVMLRFAFFAGLLGPKAAISIVRPYIKEELDKRKKG